MNDRQKQDILNILNNFLGLEFEVNPLKETFGNKTYLCQYRSLNSSTFVVFYLIQYKELNSHKKSYQWSAHIPQKDLEIKKDFIHYYDVLRTLRDVIKELKKQTKNNPIVTKEVLSQNKSFNKQIFRICSTY
jgi:hypothetical protein